ncbi:MAG: class I SAM-dependent DNA methyltransferase [Desulfovibrio sp.]|uniref:class I SAM-dependent DNA methyltransferase n=1 Tax=Desulfovibrio sp. 7SRBS1 TaxID=3378064 RepID=UPI003B407FBA
MSAFEFSAKFYDLLYEGKAYRKEADYIHALLTAHDAGHLVLELGCGSGGHATHLAEYGSTVTGVDMSADMLLRLAARAEHLPEKIRHRISWQQSDIRTFQPEPIHDSVISVFHVMSYMTTNQDLNAAFATANRGLVPGGLLVFDCWYGPAVLTLGPEKRETTRENESWFLDRKVTPVHRPNDDVVEVHYDYIARNKKTDEESNFSEVHCMRYLFRPEVENFLNNNGFSLISSHEFLTDNELSCETWTACFVARKRGGGK